MNHLSPQATGPCRSRQRILLVLEAAGGGAGRHVLDLARGLLNFNHNVALAYSERRLTADFQDGLDELTELVRLPLDMQRSVGPHDVRSARALSRLIQRTGPYDVLHAHSSKAGALLRLVTRRLPGKRVYTPHALATLDPELGLVKQFLYGNVERLLARAPQQIICVSEWERQHAARLGLPQQSLNLVHNGLDELKPANREELRRQLGLAEHEVCIGTVGRVAPQKAFDRLLAAFAMTQDTAVPVRLLLVGDGPDLPRLKALARDSGLDRAAIFAGSGDGPALMAAMDVFALSSRYEAGPYVLLEAARRGLPMVMPETGGAGWIVLDGETGFVTPQGDIEALAARLIELIKLPAVRAAMGKRARDVAAAYTTGRMVQETLAVYARA